VLSFDITGLSRNGRQVRVAHDVRTEIMKPQDVQKLSEPMCPEPDVRRMVFLRYLTKNAEQVHVLLPQLVRLRAVVERLRTLSDTIAVRANKSGRLELSVKTDSVSTDVVWTGLSNPTMGDCSITVRSKFETDRLTYRSKGRQYTGIEPTLSGSWHAPVIRRSDLSQEFPAIPEQPCRINSNNCM
jgi:hypothetical protein